MDEENFLKWSKDLTEGTNFPRQKMPLNRTQFASLLSVKSFPPVLDYMIRHVRPLNERQHIKLNLKNFYIRKHLTEEKNVSDIQRKCAVLRSSVGDAEKELFEETEGLKRIVEEEQRLLSEEKKLRCQIALLNIASKEKDHTLCNLKQRTEAVQNLIPETSDFVSPEDKSIKQKAAIDHMELVLTKLKTLKSDIITDKNEDFHDMKLEVWKSVEKLLEYHSPSMLMKALSSIISKDNNIVAQTTQDVDLIADAKALHLKYQSSGVYVDELNPHGVLESVESMLVQISALHIKKHLAHQKQKRDVKAMEASLENISNNIDLIARERYHDPCMVSSIIELYNSTIKVCGLKSKISTASLLIKSLEARANDSKLFRDSLIEKYNKIHSFDEDVKNRVNEMKSLVVVGYEGLEALQKEKLKIETIVDDGVSQLFLPTPFCKGSYSKELGAVLNIPFESLRTLQTDNGSVPIHPIGPVDDSLSDLSNMSFVVPYVTTWENIIETIRQQKYYLRQREDTLLDNLNGYEAMIKKPSNDALSNYQVKALCQKVLFHDRNLENDILPALKRCETTNDEVEKQLARLKVVLEDWWSQPGYEVKEYLKNSIKI